MDFLENAAPGNAKADTNTKPGPGSPGKANIDQPFENGFSGKGNLGAPSPGVTTGEKPSGGGIDFVDPSVKGSGK